MPSGGGQGGVESSGGGQGGVQFFGNLAPKCCKKCLKKGQNRLKSQKGGPKHHNSRKKGISRPILAKIRQFKQKLWSKMLRNVKNFRNLHKNLKKSAPSAPAPGGGGGGLAPRGGGGVLKIGSGGGYTPPSPPLCPGMRRTVPLPRVYLTCLTLLIVKVSLERTVTLVGLV